MYTLPPPSFGGLIPELEVAERIIGGPGVRSDYDPGLATFTSSARDLTSQKLLDDLAAAGVPSVVGGMKRVKGEFQFFLTVRVK